MIKTIEPKDDVIGFFVWSGDDDDFPKPNQIGEIIEKEATEPPWIVVDHELDSIVLTGWPISLWRAKVLKAIKPQDHIGSYTRCTAIEILEQVPQFKIFGDDDIGIVDIVECARNLSLESAEHLSANRNNAADQIGEKAWVKWTEKHQIEGREIHHGDWARTFGYSMVNGGSPVRGALMLIDAEVMKRAESLQGNFALDIDDEGNVGLLPPWNIASAALCDAALSLGVTDLLDSSEIDELQRPLRISAPDVFRSISSKNHIE